ncbi:MAG: hypothetical protein H6716_25105 [Polyangiaceae bacterium]|nr:hypothetical protein [Polyangiaceae bacterium]
MGFRKSDTCRGKRSGQALTEYDSEADALCGADYAKREYSSSLVPYRCSRCSQWHLSPASCHTLCWQCHWCAGREGRSKAANADREAAERRAEILSEEQGLRLRAYPCDYGGGWHLAKG